MPHLRNSYKVKNSICGHIYAKKVRTRVFGKVRSITVYSNMNTGTRDTEERNEVLQSLSKKLDIILKNSEKYTEKQLNKQIKKTLKSNHRFFTITFEKFPSHIIGKWEFNDEEITLAQVADGKYAILSSNDDLSAKEVIGEYFGKDFVEKRFQRMKSYHALMPVRHRLEHRVRGYIFLNMLALRINTVLFQKFKAICLEDTEECMQTFLKKMARVERSEVRIDDKVETVFLNLTPELKETLKLLNFSHIFEQGVAPA